MALDASDVTAIAAEITATIGDIAQIIPKSSTVTAQVEQVGPRLYAQMQAALRDRYGDLPTPMGEELRSILTEGVVAELLFLGYRQLKQDEKAWPDEWRRRFETRLAAVAAGIDRLGSPGTTVATCVAVGGEAAVFTGETLGAALGLGGRGVY